MLNSIFHDIDISKMAAYMCAHRLGNRVNEGGMLSPMQDYEPCVSAVLIDAFSGDGAGTLVMCLAQ